MLKSGRYFSSASMVREVITLRICRRAHHSGQTRVEKFLPDHLTVCLFGQERQPISLSVILISLKERRI